MRAIDHGLERIDPILLQRAVALGEVKVTSTLSESPVVEIVFPLRVVADLGEVFEITPSTDAPQKLLEIGTAVGLQFLADLLCCGSPLVEHESGGIVMGDQTFGVGPRLIFLDGGHFIVSQWLEFHIRDSCAAPLHGAQLADQQLLVGEICELPEGLADHGPPIGAPTFALRRGDDGESRITGQLDANGADGARCPDAQVDGVPALHAERETEGGGAPINAGQEHGAGEALCFIRHLPPETSSASVRESGAGLTTAEVSDADCLMFHRDATPPLQFIDEGSVNGKPISASQRLDLASRVSAQAIKLDYPYQ